jgi:hypothetical protein
MDSRRIAAAVLLLALITSKVALAAPSGTDRETARTLLDDGRARTARGDLKGALEAFKGADALMHVPTTGMFVARTQAALGLLVEARETASRVKHLPESKSEPKAFRHARVEAEEFAGQLGLRLATLAVRLRPEGRAADVSIDDAAIPAETLAIARKVNPGHHVIVAKVEGRERRVEIDLAEQESKEITLDVTPPAPAPAEVVAPAPAEVVAPAPAAAPASAPVAASPPYSPPVTDHSSRGPSPLVFAGLGLAAAGLAVGTVAGFITLSAKADATAGCVDHLCPPSTYSALDNASTLATVSTLGFVAFGVGGAVAITGIVLGRSPVAAAASGRSTATVARAYVGPGSVGLAGSF